MAVSVTRSRLCMFGCGSRIGCFLFLFACMIGSLGLIVLKEQPQGCNSDTACGWILYCSGGGAFLALFIYKLLNSSRTEKDIGVARGLVGALETARERGNIESVESLQQQQLNEMIERDELDNDTIKHIRGEELVQRQLQDQQQQTQQQPQYHRHRYGQEHEREQEQQEGYVNESEVQVINTESQSQSQSQFQPLARIVRPPPSARWCGYVTMTTTSVSEVPSPPCHAPTRVSLKLTCRDGIISGTGTETGTESVITGSYDVMTGRITFTQQVLSLSSHDTDTVYVGRFITDSHIAGTCTNQTSNGTFMLQTNF